MTKLLAVLVALSFVGCAHKQVYKDTASWNAEAGKSVQLAVKTAKFKSKKMEVTYSVTNNYEFMIVVPEGSMGLQSSDGTSMNRGNPRFEVRPGQTIVQRLVFIFDETHSGPYQLTLGGIYKGEEYTADVSKFGASWGNRSIGAVSDGYKKKSAVETEHLPSVSVTFDRG